MNKILENFLFETEEISNEKEFKEWANKLLKKAHGKNFDQDKANDVIDGLIKKYKKNWGAMIGALSSGLGE